MIRRRFPYIIVDRTAFLSDHRDRLTIQHVPACIYPASYPAWFFSESRFLKEFAGPYELLGSFEALDKPSLPKSYSKGFIFRLR
jgi:putative methyltransferase (TIGR04325 family)